MYMNNVHHNKYVIDVYRSGLADFGNKSVEINVDLNGEEIKTNNVISINEELENNDQTDINRYTDPSKKRCIEFVGKFKHGLIASILTGENLVNLKDKVKKEKLKNIRDVLIELRFYKYFGLGEWDDVLLKKISILGGYLDNMSDEEIVMDVLRLTLFEEFIFDPVGFI